MIKSVYVFICACLYIANGFHFADKFKVCHKNDPKFEACLTEAIDIGLKVLGSSGLQGFPSIEPLKASKITIGAGSSAVSLVQNYFDVEMNGFSKAKVSDVHFDKTKNVLSFKTSHPVLIQEGKYDINGKILVLPVYGKGNSRITLASPDCTHIITLGEETRNGKKYLKVAKYDADIVVKRATFNFENLFDGDKILSVNILKVVNENWSVVFNDVKDGIVKAYSQVLASVAQGIFDKVPAEEIMPN